MLGPASKLVSPAGAIVGGVLSGTSGDGIDAALVRVRLRAGIPPLESRAQGAFAPPELLAARTTPFEGSLATRVRAALDGKAPTSFAAVARLHRDLGVAFGAAVRDLARESGQAPDLVGSHGLTVYHHDGAAEAEGASPSMPATLQLGDGDFVAATAGCAVVSDFRTADVAAGGEGAPLSPLADEWIFSRAPRPLCALNLGGMANLTCLPESTEGPGVAFDTGPAGALLDGLARRLLGPGASCDRDGAAALRGRAREPFVRRVLAHPFFDRPAPKSCGRDTFGPAWVEALLGSPEAAGVSVEDLFASACEALGRSVREALERFGPPPTGPADLWVAGGGVHNPALMAALGRALAPARVRSSAEIGVDPDFREALVFAWLAVLRCLGVDRARWATGARGPRLCGKLSELPGRPGVT